MKNLLIVANWKSNKTTDEAIEYFSIFKKSYVQDPNKEVVFCPPLTLLPTLSQFIKKNSLNVKLGAQDVSPFPQGPFTGGVNAEEISEFCEYCIVGHSERRNLGEDLSLVNEKIALLLKTPVTPILCISDISQLEDTSGLSDCIIAYEPLEAIGAGRPADSTEASEKAREIKSKIDTKILYGGSVESENVALFTKASSIDGVLVGTESLDPKAFARLIDNA